MGEQDQEGLISLLRDCTPLPPIKQVASPTPRSVQPRPTAEMGLQTVGDDDWQEAPVGEKWDRIRAAWMNGKTAAEVISEAECMSVPAWLEICVKMAPKNVTVQGQVSFKHMIDNLAPIDKDEYKFNATQVEYEEVR